MNNSVSFKSTAMESAKGMLDQPQTFANPEKSSKKKETIGILAGVTIGLSPSLYVLHDTFKIKSYDELMSGVKDMQLFMPDVDTYENTVNNANKILEESGLSKKGAKIIFCDGSAESDIKMNNLFENRKPKRLMAQVKQLYGLGGNAAYDSKTKNVIVSKKGLFTSIYHELGHSMNDNKNVFTKALQKARVITPFGMSIVAPIALGFGLFHNVDKTKNSKDKSKKEKTMDFVSKHVGALTLTSYLPMLVEEAIASKRGIKMAQKYLEPNKLDKLKINYAKAWSTYGITAGILSLSVGLGVFVSNKIKHHKHKGNEQVKV